MLSNESSGIALILKVDKDGWACAIILAFLTTAGLFYVNIMPVLIDSLITGLEYNVQRAGYVGSANTFGAALGALAMVFLVKRIKWRTTAYCFLVVMIVIDLLSAAITAPVILISIRFIHGLVGGLLIGLGFVLITRTLNPDRVFGVLLALQFGLGGLAVMTIPTTVKTYGHQMPFWVLASFSLITLILMIFLPEIPEKEDKRKTLPLSDRVDNLNLESIPFLLPLVLTFMSIILFQATNMAIGAYLFGLGKAYSLSLEYCSHIVGLAYWVGALGALLVSIFGLKYGRFWPLTIAFFITLFGFLMFHLSASPIAYALANFATAATWAFIIPYLFGFCSELDVSGRMAALAGFCSKMGLTLGPVLGGWLIGSNGNYPFLINMSSLGLIIGMFAIQLALLAYKRQRQITVAT